MPVVKNLMVRAGADFSAITAQANKAKSSMAVMQTSISKSCSKMTSSVRSMGKVFAAIGVTISAAAIVAFSKNAKDAYESQAEAEAKLAQVMRNTIGASQDEIQSIKDLVSAQQALGVIGDEVQLAGAQELATYVSMTSTLQKLIPVMNDMVAQQYGYNATAENATNIATMLGKVLSGQTSGLSRYGYYFTSSQEAILKFGTEAQRAATLAEVVEQSVGGMNAALAATPSGRLKQVSNVLGDIKEQFGLAVTSIATTFLPALNTICSVLANLATLANKVAQAIANVFGGGASAAAVAVTYTAGAVSAMDDLTESTKAAGNAAKKLGTYGFDTLQKMSGTSTGGSGGGSTDAGNGGGGGIGQIGEATQDAGEAAESVGWLEKGLARLKETMDKIDFSKAASALDRLKTSAEPLTSTLFSGLKWAYDNVLEPLAQWTIEDAIPSFLDTLGATAEACTEPLKHLGEALKPLVSSAFEGLKWAYDNVFIPFANWAGTKALPEFLDTLASSVEACTGPLNRLGEALKPLVSSAFEGLKWAYDNVFIPFADWVGTEAAPAFINALASATEALNTAVDVFKPTGEWYWDEFLLPLANWTGGAIVSVLEGISGAMEKINSVVKDHPAVQKALQGIAKVAVLIGSLATPIGAAAFGLKAWSSMFNKLKEWGSNAWDGIKEAWSTAETWFSENVTTPIETGWDTATSNLKEWGSNAWDGIKEAWSTAGTWFTENVTTPISTGFKSFANDIIGFFEGLVNGAVDGINRIIGGINGISVTIPDWVPGGLAGKSIGFAVPTVPSVSLPRLANGAVFKGGHPYAAIVNDQTHGVNVETPLATMIEAMMTALRATDFGSDVQVNVRAVFDGQLAALARLLRPYFEADAQRVGKQASTAKGVL